jgi:23S rRNA (cytosine1962-C5)-methyltransferase
VAESELWGAQHSQSNRKVQFWDDLEWSRVPGKGDDKHRPYEKPGVGANVTPMCAEHNVFARTRPNRLPVLQPRILLCVYPANILDLNRSGYTGRVIDPLSSLESTRERDALISRLEIARSRRIVLENDATTTAYRLVNADGDGIPGLTLDHVDGALVASLYTELGAATENALIETIAELFKPRAVYLKRRPREARHLANTDRDQLAPELPVYGETLETITALENGVKYAIRPGGDLSVGLFLDMRDTRAWLRPRVREKTVLNAFAYTCGFGVVARLGRASRVVNLDLSRRVLDWGAQNYALNGLEAERPDFISGDVFDWLDRFARKHEQFDVVILDPPSFSTAKGSRFSAAADYDKLAALASRIVAPGGTMLACCNHAKLPRRAFARMLEEGIKRAGRRASVIASLRQSEVDYPVPDDLEGPLKVIALEL